MLYGVHNDKKITRMNKNKPEKTRIAVKMLRRNLSGPEHPQSLQLKKINKN